MAKRTGAKNVAQSVTTQEPVVAKVGVNSDSIIVFVKTRAYVNDTQRVDAGLYLIDEIPERWSKLGKDTVEIFKGEVPSRRLAEIAKWSGINPDGVEDDVLIDKLLCKEFKPF